MCEELVGFFGGFSRCLIILLGTIALGSKTGFTLDELVSLVKVFRLFRLEQFFFWCTECEHNK
jgi:hypothetical protein